MKIFNCILFIFLYCTGFCQSTKCDCESYLDWKKIEKRNVEYDSLYIKVAILDTLKDDGCEENFKILKDSSNYLLIVPFWNNPKKKMKQIWIKKDGQLMTTIQCERETFNIYLKPDSTSKTCFSEPSKKANLGFLHVKGCRGMWFNVEYLSDDKKYVGWVHKYSTCSNPCTTCN
ncbi:MAG: hypothetical protein ACLQQ4_00470 [Bacteroidia bacterium]